MAGFIVKRKHPFEGYCIYCYLAAYLAGGWFTVEEVWERLQQRAIDVHFLMLAVAVGSASIGAWGEGSTLLFLFSFSGALEHFALGRTQREIHSLFKEAPKVASVSMRSGRESEVPVERLRRGMRLLIKPGAQFPVDGEIVKGQTASDESNLTGRSRRRWTKGYCGRCGVGGHVESLGRGGSGRDARAGLRRKASLQKMASSSSGEAQQQKAPSQLFTDKFGTFYTYSILALSLVMFFVWWLAFGLDSRLTGRTGHAERVLSCDVTLLVVASPCALVLSIPSAVLAAIAWGARHGILFRGGAAVEKLAGINIVALDKTGGAHHRGIAGGAGRRKFSARERKRSGATGILTRTALHASSRAGDHALRQAAETGAG